MNKQTTKTIKLPTESTPQSLSIEALLTQAIEKGVPVETMERLLAMRTQLKQEWQKEQFNKAIAEFQKECPIIQKNTKVKDKYGKDRYQYAKIEDIINQIKGIISKNGLSYRFDEEKDEKFAKAICHITHITGHTESTPFAVPIGHEDYMTDVQKYGARMTFAKRYAFCNAFGILTGDEDNDANESKESKDNTLLNKVIESINKAENTESLKEFSKTIAKSEKYTEKQKTEIQQKIDNRIKELL